MNYFIITLICIVTIYIINSIIYYQIDKRLIKNNIELFIKRHESQVIHEVNNELFKKDKRC